MGLAASTIGLITAGTTAVATVASISNNRQSRKAQEASQAEQRAVNKAQQAEEMRKQIREERIRRARILQSAEASGTSGSSGEAGAISSLSTQLGSNIGFNQNLADRGAAISQFQQNAADAANAAQTWSMIGNLAPSVARVSNNIFNSPVDNGLQGPLINQVFPNNTIG